MTAHANTTTTRPASAAPARACPRCRAILVVIQRQVRRAETITALMCPCITCGYKLIVPR